MKPVYVDNNATTKVAPEVFAAMEPFFCEMYGNPSSMHSVGGSVGPKIKAARAQVANLIGAQADEIIFTSCGTESDNAAVHAALTTDPGKRHIVTSRVEHPAIGSLAGSLSKQGYRITEVPVDGDGCLDLDFLEENLTPDTA
ncbi:MAG: aminotransferase class V-fold PLP-dependent enzyme, partial [Deltaproteobacteria bacterium]|nr:aminotransferase class V-fold PLP-dependent enzyme [Deltaproteobacteria bacterium]